MCRDVSCVVTPTAYAVGWKKLSPPRRLKYWRGIATLGHEFHLVAGRQMKHLRFAPNGAHALSRLGGDNLFQPQS